MVKWKDLPDYKNSSELFTVFKCLFPLFHFEDKVPLDREANVRSHIYISRKKRKFERNKTRGSGKLEHMSTAQLQRPTEMIGKNGKLEFNVALMKDKK